MSVLKWYADRVGNPMTLFANSALAGLTDGTSVLSAAITNNTEADLYADFFLTVGFVSAPTFGYAVELYIVGSDGNNVYDDTTGPNPPMNGYGDTFPVRAQTAVQTIRIPMIELPPRDFKVLLRNKTGQTFAATGNLLTGFFYKRQVV